MKKYIAIITLSVFSIANAIYLTLAAFSFKANWAEKLFCDINDTFSCSSLFSFDFAWIFGIPFPLIALCVYPIIAWIALYWIIKKSQKAFLAIMIIALCWMCFNWYIIYNEFQVWVFCPACLACSASITTIAIISAFWRFYKN